MAVNVTGFPYVVDVELDDTATVVAADVTVKEEGDGDDDVTKFVSPL